jgi:N-acetylglucosaminyldiphosphoundecaprenol N-acetyl-beta-D-mannosaminyltransferase
MTNDSATKSRRYAMTVLPAPPHLALHTPAAPASRQVGLPTVSLLGLPIHCVTTEVAVAHILDSLERGVGGWVMTPNVDILRRWVRDEQFRMLAADVTLCVADGMPLVWASRVMRTPLPERVCGADLTRSLLAAAADQSRSVFFLGGAPDAADAAADAMRAAHPHINIAGTYCPPFGFENMPAEWSSMAEALYAAQADMVFVGLGCPKQEVVIDRLRPILPGAWWLGVGVSFSFLGHTIGRAPGWMQRSGLEWLHRLSREPRRLAHRYLIDDAPFAAWMLLRAACGNARGDA